MNVQIPLLREKAYEKYAWILLAGPVIFLTLLSLMPLIGGYYYVNVESVINLAVPSSTPAVTINYLNVLARDDGLTSLFLGILLTAITVTSFRKYNRLAWYVMLWFFLGTTASTVFDETVNSLPGHSANVVVLPAIALSLMALGVFLPYRRFFPKRSGV